MSLPLTGPADLAPVKRLVGIDDGDTSEDDELLDVIAATNAVVRSWRCAQVGEGLDDWDDPKCAAVRRGSVMLAARLYRRKDTPDGVATFGADGPVYVQRNDPDIAMLLGIGAYAKPSVG